MVAPTDTDGATSSIKKLSLTNQPSSQQNSQSGPQQNKQTRLSFFDASYAARTLPVVGGERVKALANFFDINISQLPDHIFLYSFSFPQINGRDIKNRGVKKELIRLVLQDQFFVDRAKSFATDWDALLVSLVDLAAEPGSGFVQGTQKQVVVGWRNQAQRSQLLNLPVDVRSVDVLAKAKIQTFVERKAPSDYFDCSRWLQVLNILARKRATEGPDALTVKIGREKFFSLSSTATPQWTSGIHPRTGHVSSVRPVYGKLAMNLQRVATAFITEQPLLDFVHACEPGFGPQAWLDTSAIAKYEASFRTITKGLQVRYMYSPPDTAKPQRSALLPDPVRANPPGRLRRVNALGKAANLISFTHSSPAIGTTTVEKSFTNHVMAPQHPLQYPDLPCINTGSQANPVWVPAELLYIEPNQPKRGVLEESEMRLMAPIAQQSPNDNIRDIKSVVAPNGIFELSSYFENSALTISHRMKEVSARMLPTPSLHYSQDGEVRQQDGGRTSNKLRDGAWTLQGKKFPDRKALAGLGIIHFGESVRMHAYESLSAALTAYGIQTGGGRRINEMKSTGTDPDELNAALRSLVQKDSERTITAILVMLGSHMSQSQYAEIKHWADTQVGIPSVCVAKANHSRLQDAPFQANLALKINAKLGGKNHTLSNGAIPNDTMVVGADVTHPGLGSVGHCPSAAAVVASNDQSAMVYPGSLRLQKGKEEMIVDLADMIAERLEEWKKNNENKLPTRILFYRDGVSEGQFPYVKAQELPRIRSGCKKVDPNYQPPVTLVVCGKRHHTRFYPDKDHPAPPWARDGKTGNFKPGLLVDDLGVRSPWYFDFYLQSHKALKGTARPCHYFVISNDMRLEPAHLQQITFNLCFTFQTALTPISYASPAYYADRLCDRARCYLRPLMQLHHPQRPSELTINAHMTTVAGSTWATAEDDQKDIAFATEVANGWKGYWPAAGRANPAHDDLKDTMFYI